MSHLVPFKEMEALLDNYFKPPRRRRRYGADDDNGDMTIPDWSPAVDIHETKESYIIRAELPGVQDKDVSATLEQGILTIRGEKKFTKHTGDHKSHRVESAYGQFVRNFSLPSAVQEDQVSAVYKDGVLTLTIPKAAEAQPKSITIQTA